MEFMESKFAAKGGLVKSSAGEVVLSILGSKRLVSAVFVVWFSLFWPVHAHAYIGPGAGVSAIGSLLALCATVVVAILGFLWFPIKRLMKKRKASLAERAKTTMVTRTQDSGE